jgi:hypothetical protein
MVPLHRLEPLLTQLMAIRASLAGELAGSAI